MGKRKEKVVLSAAEQTDLRALVSKGRHSVHEVRRAQILLRLDKGETHKAIAQVLGVCLATVYNVHERFLQERLAALKDKPRPGQPPKVTPALEAAITRIACSQAPPGKGHWSVRMIHGQVVELGYQVGREAVRRVLKKASSSPGRSKGGVSAS